MPPVAAALGTGRRVIALDYAGRGDSGRARDVNRYAPEACVRDVLDVCAALHVDGAVGIGTSFGGLLCMGIAAARHSLLHAVVLNDVGPEIGGDGADFVRRFVADGPGAAQPRGLHRSPARRAAATVAAQRRGLAGHGRGSPMRSGADGRWHPVWDTQIAELLRRDTPDLWPLFGAMAHMKLLLVRGEASNILLPDTVARMARHSAGHGGGAPAGHRPCPDACRADDRCGAGRVPGAGRMNSGWRVGTGL